MHTYPPAGGMLEEYAAYQTIMGRLFDPLYLVFPWMHRLPIKVVDGVIERLMGFVVPSLCHSLTHPRTDSLTHPHTYNHIRTIMYLQSTQIHICTQRGRQIRTRREKQTERHTRTHALTHSLPRRLSGTGSCARPWTQYTTCSVELWRPGYDSGRAREGGCRRTEAISWT